MTGTITIRGECQCGEAVIVEMPGEQYMCQHAGGAGDLFVRCPDCRHPTLCSTGSTEGDHS